MLTDEDRKTRLATALKWGLGIGAAMLIAPVIFLAVKGLVGLGLALLAGLVIINAAPVVALRLATWKIAGLKGLARSNPIEVREKLALDRHAMLEKKAQSITDYATEVSGFANEVQNLAQQYPQDAEQFKSQLDTCNRLLEHQRAEYKRAVAALQEFERATQRARAKWKVAQSALRMQRLSGAQADSAMEKILADEALDSVEHAMDQAFAGLDTAIMKIEATRQALPAGLALPNDSNVIDLTPVAEKAKVAR